MLEFFILVLILFGTFVKEIIIMHSITSNKLMKEIIIMHSMYNCLN